MPGTVLIVDDDPGFRDAARLLLELEGYDVVGEAGDGEAGVRRAAELAPDLVLLDVQMPGMDGLEAATRITAVADGPSVVITSSQERVDIAGTGARGFIPKAELSGDRIAALLG
jgi:DNA-binding NarL/FixJ family response regulator